METIIQPPVSSASIGGEPIKFVDISPDGQFSVTAEAMSMLEKHQARKIAVVAVAGPHKTGKSFLCNRMLGRMNGFGIGSSAESGTSGIWMWSELIPVSGPDGADSGTDILLLDIEGLHSPQRSYDIDVKIFALTILLASNLVYNQIGNISDQALENLSMVLLLTNEIKVRHQHETGLEFKSFFPDFSWVLRDCSLDFKHLTPETYLEQCLEQERGFSDDTQKNAIRQSLKKFFPKIECMSMGRPVDDQGLLARLEELAYKDLKAEFRSICEQLVNKSIRVSPKVKSINNRPLTGYMLLGLALEYVDNFNRGESPVIMSAFERVVSIESERFLEQLYEETLARIHQRFDFAPRVADNATQFAELEVVYTNHEMDAYLEQLISECDLELARRLQNILSVRNLVEQRNDFEQRITNYFEANTKEENIIRSRKYCHSLLEQISSTYSDKMQELMNIQSISDLKADTISSMLAIYNKIIVTYNLYAQKDIPYRSEALADFLQATILDELHGVFCELDMAYQAHFTKEKITIQEQLRQNQKLQSIVESSADKLAYVKASRAGQQAERDTLQLQLDQE